ncbi:MAG: LPXTG cell wall anchor domain-containing protein, partial [Aerococcus sp.]|nr:LPXTG cell wall anchor domain-containing protein [Aerococcus sp.]
PIDPEQPGKPMGPEMPGKPMNEQMGHSNHMMAGQKDQNSKVSNEQATNMKKLPQTGASEDRALLSAGVLLAAMGLFALSGAKQRKK